MVGQTCRGNGAEMTNAEKIHAALKQRPMTRVELEEVLGLGQVSVELALRRLRKTHKVYTIQAGQRIHYELAK